MSTKKSKNKITITQQRIKSSKNLLVLCSLIALLADIAVVAVLLMNVTEWTFWICPVILLALNTLFLFGSFYSNYRFAYALRSVWFHIVLVLLASVGSWVLTSYLESRIVFETVALYAMPATHLLQCFTVLMTALYARRKGKGFRRTVTVLVTLLFVAFAGLYGFFLATEGFFGQGFAKEHRILAYSYDETKNYYVAEGVLDGRGGTIVIPSEFNGLPVGGINCELFENTEIKIIELACDTNVTFENVDALKGMREDLHLSTSKDKIDSFRQALYALKDQDEDIISLANNIVPNDIATDEVYIICQYTKETLEAIEDEILPVWIEKKNTKFDFDDHAKDLNCIKYSDATNDADLYYCYTHQNGKIFSGIVDEENTDLNGLTIKKSANIVMQFNKVYRLGISEDNDTKYTIDETIRFTETVDGTVEYKFAIAEYIDAILAALPARPGFDLTWKVGSRNLGTWTTELESLDAINKDTLLLTPEWSLKVPNIHSIMVNGAKDSNRVIYGNTANIVANATSPDSSIDIRYEWKKGNTPLGCTSNVNQIQNFQPTDAGYYQLTVTAYSDTITSLTSQVSQSANVEFVKKDLHLSWMLPSNLIYSATDKQISVVHDETDVINSDVIDVRLSRSIVRDAGTYTIKASLSGDSNTKYKIVSSDENCGITIDPYPVAVDWNVPTFVYSGSDQCPTASAEGLGADMIIISIAGAQKNAGTYTATATTTNRNYLLLGDSQEYTIEQRPISIVQWDRDTFTYNGKKQGPKVAELFNVVPGEERSILDEQLSYFGLEINVNSSPYTITAELPADSNYCFDSSGSDVTTFTILPTALQITIANMREIYTGTIFTEFKISDEGLMETDKLDEVLELSFYGSAVSAINVDPQAYELNADVIAGEKHDNYIITIIPGTLTILPKELTITLNTATKVYDGAIYPYNDFGFTHEGLAMTDQIEEVCNIVFEGEALEAINASSIGYTLSASTVALSKYTNYNIEIVNSTLKITPAPLTVTAISGTKIYDGYAGSEFSFTVDGLQGGDTVEMLGTPNYGGSATNTYTVGTHKLSVRFNDNATTNNYDIDYINGTYEITKKDLTVTAVGTSKIYDGIAGGTFSFTADGLADRDSLWMLGTATYSGAASTNKNVGMYELTVSLPNNSVTKNYNITYLPGELEITPRSVTVSANATSKIYDGLEGGNFTFTVNNMVKSDTIAVFGTPYYSGTATTARNVGTYELNVILPGNDNYNIISYASGTFEITPKAITVTPISTEREYDGTIGGTFDFSVTGLADCDSKELFGTPEFAGSALTAKNAASYSLTITLPEYSGSNYTITYRTGTFTIKKKALTVTATGKNKVYDGQRFDDAYEYEVSGLIDGETVDMLGKANFSGSAITAINVGEYALKVRLQSNAVTNNYVISYQDGNYKITKKALTVKAIATNRVYDGTAGGDFTVDVTGLVSKDTVAMLGNPIWSGTATTAKNVGTYTLKVQFATSTTTNNYDISYEDATFTITKKALTVKAVAEDRVYDGTVGGEFTVDVTGLASKDTVAMLGNPIWSGTATSAKNVGTYTLKVQFADSTTTNNYDISYEDATFTITKKALTIKAVAKDRVYDGTVGGEFTVEMTGLASTDTTADFGDLIWGGTATTAKDAGTYELTVQVETSTLASNYEITYIPDEDFVISPAI